MVKMQGCCIRVPLLVRRLPSVKRCSTAPLFTSSLLLGFTGRPVWLLGVKESNENCLNVSVQKGLRIEV